MIWPFKQNPKQAGKDRVDELANKLYASGKIEDIEDELTKLDLQKLSKKEKKAWYQLYGICAFRRNNHKDALARFSEAHKLFPDSGQIAFSLGQSYENSGNPEKAFSIFDKFIFPAIPAPYALAQARYAYLWNDPKRMLTYVTPIMDAYYKLRIVDDHFLYVRGLPFFGNTFGYVTLGHILQGQLDEIQQIVAKCVKQFSDYDFAQIQHQLRCIAQNQYDPIIDELKQQLESAKSQNSPASYQQVQLAVLLAQKSINYEEGLVALNVALPPQNFPLLNDVTLLARCELANRFQLSGDEEIAINNFMTRQPTLFEPDHAFNFNLHQYQEKLKAIYQQNRKAYSQTLISKPQTAK